jgi:hypothetical protein
MIRFSDIKTYLTAIAKKAQTPIGASPHKAFWEGMDRAAFTTGTVPHVGVPIMNIDEPLKSPIFVVLTDKNGLESAGIPQMPEGGDFVTDPGYKATLPDGTEITGQQIIDNMKEWLTNGFPE